ncbi:DUF4253 domain-containing protein [Undibacterium sp. TS12]|uniref:DUF4253 domain-containing protein n=1 Tax=Undibacterium sp. TS12 TaxID=2908202 RepID=UPI001F4D0E88|nr:DUF4253 domain-containing protein [Undibacterium sp. TS12]MCH8620389.1 DUF4253 domain-containing protein [Undibacterium sp. TS12]
MQLDYITGEYERFLCDRYACQQISGAADMIATYHSLLDKNPGYRFLFTLDDLGQALYTSMHASSGEDLDDVEGYDLSHLPASCFEDGQHLGYLTCKEELFIVRGNIEKKCRELDFEDVCARGISLFHDSIDEFKQANQDILSILDEECFILKVPVTHQYETICAFPNGYFSCDLSPMENLLFARLLDEQFGYQLIGIGASYVAFLKTRELDESEIQSMITMLARVYADEFNETLTSLLADMIRGQEILVLTYTE